MPRLDVLLARNLGASRRTVKDWLRQGRIADPDGAVLDDPRLSCPPSSLPRALLVDGEPTVLHDRISLLLHKPVGVVTALRDDRHATAYSLLAHAPLLAELRAIGRLDLDTSGLLLWTTDGTLLHRLTHPRYGLPRTYHAGLTAAPSGDPAAIVLDDGHRPEIGELRALPCEAMHPALRRSDDARAWASITIHSGRFHEVRRIFAALGCQVVDLCRVAYGGVELPRALPAGAWERIDLHSRFSGLSPRAP